MKANLAPHGLVCFDVNALSLHQTNFCSGRSDSMSSGQRHLRGLSQKVEPGRTFEAELSGPDVEAHIHHQRHLTTEELGEAILRSARRATESFLSPSTTRSGKGS